MVTFLLTPNALFTEFMIGMTETLANHGVAHTLNMSRSGNSAFVMAYAVANLPQPSYQPRTHSVYLDRKDWITHSTTSLTPPSPLFHHTPSFPLFRTLPFFPSSPTISPSLSQPLRLNQPPNFAIPSATHFPSLMNGGIHCE